MLIVAILSFVLISPVFGNGWNEIIYKEERGKIFKISSEREEITDINKEIEQIKKGIQHNEKYIEFLKNDIKEQKLQIEQLKKMKKMER